MLITPAGTLLRERAQAILALLEETSRDIQLISQERHMLIRIATIGSINSQILPEKIAHFCSAYPYVNFQVVEGRTESVLAALRENEADIGFVREPFNVTAFRVVPIRNTLLPPEGRHFVALAKPYFFEGSDSDAIPLEDLQGKPLVTHRRYREMLVTACRKHGFTPHIICENDGIQSSLSWAQTGIGIAIAPYTSAVINTDSSLVIRHLEDLNSSAPGSASSGTRTKSSFPRLTHSSICSEKCSPQGQNLPDFSLTDGFLRAEWFFAQVF